jgi:hypothetical protein
MPRSFCGNWRLPLRSHGELENASIVRWGNVSPGQARNCERTLRQWLMDYAPGQALIWRGQIASGWTLGSDIPRFHFQQGMTIRNVLRRALADEQLPTGPKNWDDWYYGALWHTVRHTLITEVVAACEQSLRDALRKRAKVERVDRPQAEPYHQSPGAWGDAGRYTKEE